MKIRFGVGLGSPGGMSVQDQLRQSQKLIGLGGAVVGIGVGLSWATRKPAQPSLN